MNVKFSSKYKNASLTNQSFSFKRETVVQYWAISIGHFMKLVLVIESREERISFWNLRESTADVRKRKRKRKIKYTVIRSWDAFEVSFRGVSFRCWSYINFHLCRCTNAISGEIKRHDLQKEYRVVFLYNLQIIKVLLREITLPEAFLSTAFKRFLCWIINLYASNTDSHLTTARTRGLRRRHFAGRE